MSILANSSGSFSFTHASFAAVKLPGELSRWLRHCSGPMVSNASLPYFTARPSHHIIDGRRTLQSLSTHTSPCIWYDIPIALTALSADVSPAFSATRCVACRSSVHHISGSCSAHPAWCEMMGASVSGYCALATVMPVEASTSDALTDDVPMSYPSRYSFSIMIGFDIN